MNPAAAARAAEPAILGVTAVVAVATVGAWAQRTPLPLFSDDVAYLANACGSVTLAGLEWGPGYAAVYCAFRHAFTDPLHAFWVKQAVVPLWAGALVYGLGLLFRLGPVLAALSALWCVLALLAVNGTVEFAFCLGLTACLCAAREGRWGAVWFFVLMGLASLVRLEYLVGIVSALALLLLRRTEGRRRGLAAGGVVLAAGLVLVLAGRSGAPGGGRTWFAFGQQFAVNYAEAHHLALDPYVEWARVTAEAFATSDSVGEAVRENPRLFGWHLGYNALVRLPRALAGVVVPVPAFAPWVRLRVILGAAAVVLIGMAALAGATRGRLRDPRLLPLLALATVAAVSLLFRPQARHFLPLLPLAVVLAGRGLRSGADVGDGRLGSTLRSAFACVLFLGLASAWASLARTPPAAAASLATWVRDLRRDVHDRPLRLLASWYADRVCALVGPECATVSLPAFIGGQETDMVLIGPDWPARPEVQAHAQLRAFLARPEAFGCTGGSATPEGFRLVRCRPPLGLAAGPAAP